MPSLLLKIIFYQRSVLPFSTIENENFETIYSKAIQNNGVVDYQSNFPKYRFIDYLIQKKNFVVHGSNNKNINQFETREQTLFNGQMVNAIFATKDGVWPIFYAILDRSKLVRNFRNGCIKSSNSKRYYFFSLTKETIDSDPWTTGMIYFLSSERFERSSQSKVYFDEWISKEVVKPVIKLVVGKEDFEYIDKISIHNHRESIITTWLLYKIRTSFLSHS